MRVALVARGPETARAASGCSKYQRMWPARQPSSRRKPPRTPSWAASGLSLASATRHGGETAFGFGRQADDPGADHLPRFAGIIDPGHGTGQIGHIVETEHRHPFVALVGASRSQAGRIVGAAQSPRRRFHCRRPGGWAEVCPPPAWPVLEHYFEFTQQGGAGRRRHSLPSLRDSGVPPFRGIGYVFDLAHHGAGFSSQRGPLRHRDAGQEPGEQ